MLTESELRVSLIGCGRVARHYVKIFRDFLQSDPIRCVGVYDINPEASTNIAKGLDCRIFKNYREIDSLNTDLVILLTPSGMHEDNAYHFLSEGIPTLSEKPIGLNVKKIIRNIEIASAKKTPYGVIFQNRMNPAMQYARSIVSQHLLGKLVSASVRLRWCRLQDYYRDAWHGTWAMDGGVICQQAIHHIDGLRWLIGEPREVFAIGLNQVNQLEAEDTLVACGMTHTMVPFTIEATTAARPGDQEASIVLTGSAGSISIGGTALNEVSSLVVMDHADRTAELKSHSEEVDDGYGVSHYRVLRDIALNYKKNGMIQMPVSAEDGLQSVKFVHSLYASVEAGKNIICDESAISSKLGL